MMFQSFKHPCVSAENHCGVFCMFRYADWKKVWNSIPVHTYDSLHWRQQLHLVRDDAKVQALEQMLAKKERRL